MDMRLQLEKDITLGSVHEQFNKAFPFLRLEFFRGLGGSKKTLPKDEKLKAEQPARKTDAIIGTAAGIDINKNMTVAGPEDEFRKKTGLKVQVFRKAGTVWIETSLTNDWTLEQQNREGESISSTLGKTE